MAGLRILYVEDNAELREMFCELMAAPGCSIQAMPDGESAWAAWQRQPADVLLTDISLPDMSGTELARKVLARRPLQWVVFCSGYDPTQAMRQLGANVRAIPKAFDCDELEALLTEIAMSLAAGAPA